MTNFVVSKQTFKPENHSCYLNYILILICIISESFGSYNYSVQFVAVRSITECVIQCSFHNSKCQSGFFKSKKKVCQLFNVTLGNVTVRDSNENIYFENTTLLTGKQL